MNLLAGDLVFCSICVARALLKNQETKKVGLKNEMIGDILCFLFCRKHGTRLFRDHQVVSLTRLCPLIGRTRWEPWRTHMWDHPCSCGKRGYVFLSSYRSCIRMREDTAHHLPTLQWLDTGTHLTNSSRDVWSTSVGS